MAYIRIEGPRKSFIYDHHFMKLPLNFSFLWSFTETFNVIENSPSKNQINNERKITEHSFFLPEILSNLGEISTNAILFIVVVRH